MVIMKMRDTDIQPFLIHLSFLAETKWKGKNGVLAEDAGISGGYLSEVLKGKKIPSEEVAVKISTACGYKYEEFLEEGFKLGLEKGSLIKQKTTGSFTGEVFLKAVKDALKDLQQKNQPNDIETKKAKKNAAHHEIVDEFPLEHAEKVEDLNRKLLNIIKKDKSAFESIYRFVKMTDEEINAREGTKASNPRDTGTG